jgi:hypothetical protein
LHGAARRATFAVAAGCASEVFAATSRPARCARFPPSRTEAIEACKVSEAWLADHPGVVAELAED